MNVIEIFFNASFVSNQTLSSTKIDIESFDFVEEVVYDKQTGVIKSVPGLMYNNTSNQYTLRNMDKKVSTLKSLNTTTNKSP